MNGKMNGKAEEKTGFIAVVFALVFMYLWAKLNYEYWLKNSESLYTAAFIGF